MGFSSIPLCEVICIFEDLSSLQIVRALHARNITEVDAGILEEEVLYGVI